MKTTTTKYKGQLKQFFPCLVCTRHIFFFFLFSGQSFGEVSASYSWENTSSSSRVCLASELCGWARVWAVCQLLPESLGQGSAQHNLVYLILLSMSRTLILMTAKVYVVAVGSQPCNSFEKRIWLGQLWPYLNTSVPFETLRWKVMRYFPSGCCSWLSIIACWITGSDSAGLSLLGWQIWRGGQWVTSLKQLFWLRHLKLELADRCLLSTYSGQVLYRVLRYQDVWDSFYQSLATTLKAYQR